MDSPPLTEAHRNAARRQLDLAWADGHRASFDYDYLRGWCPCAGCQGHVGEPLYRPTGRPVEPLDIQPVGNYAIGIQWSDGHATGIYRYDFLRAICPCPVCQGDADGSGSDSRTSSV